jgi:ribulose-5-phosphate 4-epimerase/fuculose-1-phosphate aldolase
MSVTSLPVEKQSPEWRQRVELAACYRLLAHYKMTDLIYTHATVRVPGEAGQFLINPYGWRWEEITASSLVKIDVDLARHDAACVVHTHTRAGMAVSAVKDGLLPISQIALQYYGRLGVHDYEGIALDLDERQRIIRDLGGYCGLILRNHGLLTVGRSVAEAFSLMFYLNLACEVQVATLSMGAELVIPPKEVCERVGKQYDQMAFDDGDLQLEWAAHLRMLDADPSYRT